MPSRTTTRGRTRERLPFLVVVDQDIPGNSPRRDIDCARKTFHTARQRAIQIRDLYDSFFGEDADFFVMRVVDSHNYAVLFEHY